MERNRFQSEVRPAAIPENMVQGKTYRFTVLSPSLIRMEYSPEGLFEDRATQTVFFRDFPKCEYSCRQEDGTLVLETEALVLRYAVDKPFDGESLVISLKIEPASTWRFGEDFEDMGGTTQTLDLTDGSHPVERGICSRNGFSVLDDSDRLPLEKDGWIGVRHPNATDCYFFGYGFDYLGAVRDFYKLTGEPPMLPAYALGNWWSRYYPYTQQEYLDLMDRFREEDLPFSVGVVDMDWHITQIPEELKDEDPRMADGWTGYSWNKALFPDYKAFLKALHDRNLKTALNLHPAVGTCCHEDMYPEMARANGIDPETKQRVPLDLLSRKHMETYFDILHHPYENDGVDFWWMDWQQGNDYWWIHEANKPGEYQDPRERVNPLWMLNHLHILDISRDGSKRPMFFSRYSGPGSHRYPVGFSGDTIITWASLAFQPWFTANSSNIGYCWWSHDIGGHMGGIRDEELYARWVQLGVFSPINRLHSSNNRWQQKEPWSYNGDTEKLASDWLRLRHRLFPYIYTMNYRTHSQLQPLVQPMYYSHPKFSGAYEVPNQFWFGSELIAAPITEKTDKVTGLAKSQVWLPKGHWFDFFTGLHYASRRGRKLRAYRDLSKMPVFARSGAIVPMAGYAKGDNRLGNSEHMEVLVFPGADNVFALYEDAGDGFAYKDGAFAMTELTLSWGERPVFTIGPALGDLTQIPEKRFWRIGLRGFHKNVETAASVDGKPVAASAQWDAQCNTLWLSVEADVTSCIRIEILGENLICENEDVLERCAKLLEKTQCPYVLKEQMWKEISDTSKRLVVRLLFAGGFTLETDSLSGAVEELLTLTEDKWLGSEIPEN